MEGWIFYSREIPLSLAASLQEALEITKLKKHICMYVQELKIYYGKKYQHKEET